MINFKDYGIDHIYCINYIKNNRKPIIEKEFDFIGIDYHNSDLFSWEYDYDNNVIDLKEIYKEELEKHTLVQKQYNHYFYKLRYETFKLSLRNYSIMKKSLDLGYEKIMVFEDDIVFLKDLNFIKEILDHQDYNCDLLILAPSAKFSRLFEDYIHNDYAKHVYNFYDYYVSSINIHHFDLYCAGCNIYNRDAMKAYIWIIENICTISPDLYCYYEHYPYKQLKLNASIYPICCQRSDLDEIANFKTTKITQYRI